MTDESAKRIAAALERLAKAVEQRGLPPFPMGPVQPFDPNRCGFCGGNHVSSGLPCPALAPMGITP